MFGPWIEIFTWFKSLWPGRKSMRFPRPNFLMIHYMYLIGLTLLGSVLIYPAGEIRYIDALFFSAGAATQSGLNTINVNDLYLYQQIVLMLMACIANPIFINSFVVFVRLYWFEKRFQKVVLEAQKFRRTRTKERSRTNTEAKEDHDHGLEEMGVGDRMIKVIHPSDGTIANAAKINSNNDTTSEEESSNGTSSNGNQDAIQQSEQPRPDDSSEKFSPTLPRREITFRDEVQPQPSQDNNDAGMVPIQRTAAEHIAFLENQRNPKDTETLYIPGPRDFERGIVPQNIDFDTTTDNERQQRAHFAELPHRTYTNEDNISLEHGPTSKNHTSIYSPHSPQAPTGSRRRFQFPSKSRNKEEDGDSQPPKLNKHNRAATFRSFLSTRSEDEDPMPYLSWQPTIGRNSAFVDLNETQREELGGIEYRALKLLALILVCYFVGFHILGLLSLLPWIKNSGVYTSIVTKDGINNGWWSVFTAASMFNDLGFTLTPDSMYSFKNAVWPLLMGSFLIVIGNTGFPCMLRFVIWVCAKFTPRGSAVWEELCFLLDHPRRCFTLLFPGKATWWLFWVLVLLNGLDLLFFIILDLNDKTVTSLPAGIRVLDGWFQAVSTRTAGFAVVNLANLHPAIQVSYLLMMYISVFPIAISVRRTNVYEEKSLGIWGGDPEDDTSNEQSYVGSHLRRQLSFDLWYVFLGLFLVCIVEGNRIQSNKDYAFTIFSVLFEIVSAYGTVGLSLGYPGIDASFSAEFASLSKLIIIAMMIRGRHRGLPYALDRAILLPSESLNQKEQEEAERRMNARRASNLSQMEERERKASVMSANEALDRTLRNHSVHETYEHKKSGGMARLISNAMGTGPAMRKLK